MEKKASSGPSQQNDPDERAKSHNVITHRAHDVYTSHINVDAMSSSH